MRISDGSSDVCSSDLQVVKIVSDALTEMLGSETAELELAVTPPAVIMMVGLQGSGKTTTTEKIAKRLKEKERSEEHTSELQSLMSISYAVFCLQKKTT